MPDKRTDLEVNVTARTDQAKRELGVVSGEVKELEGDHEIGVSVDDDATDPIADIRAKLDRLTDEDREIALKGNASRLEAEVRKAERALGNLDRYDNEEIEIRLDVRDMASRKLQAVRDELDQLDRRTADVDVDATGGVGAPGGIGGIGGVGRIFAGGAVAAGAKSVAESFADSAIDAQTLATATGSTLDEASRLLFVAQSVGLEYADVFDILSQMNQVFSDTPELAKRLKVDRSESGIDQFLDAVAGLQTEVDNVGERGVLAGQLFGEEGVRQIGRLQTEIGDLTVAVENVPTPVIITDEDVEDVRNFKREWRELEAQILSTGRTAVRVAGNVLLPALTAKAGTKPDGSGGLSLLSGWADIPGGAWDLLNNPPDWWPGNQWKPAETLSRDQVMGLQPGGFAPSNITVINPPGTPAMTRQQYDQWIARNGDRS